MNQAVAATFFFLSVSLPALAATPPHPLHPERQPLLVARAADGGKATELLAAAPVESLGLADFDFRGGIPGLNARVESLRGLLDDLSATGATNLWYCLSRTGSPSGMAAGLGWRWPAGFPEDEAARWLRANSFAPDRLATVLQTRTGLGLFLALADKGETLAALTRADGTQSASFQEWRGDLAAFLAKPTDALGLWFDPRPLLGVAALASGVDLRGALARLKLSMPRACGLEIVADNGQIGLELALSGLFPNPLEPLSGPSPLLDYPLPPTRRAFVRLTLSEPYPLLKALGLDAAPFYMANIDFHALVPRLVGLDVWLDEAGEPRWSLVFLMGEKTSFLKHFRRLLAVADLLGGRLGLFNGVTPLPTHSAGEAYALEIGDLTVRLEVADVPGAEKENVFLIAAERREDYPVPETIEVKTSSEDRTLSWRIGLDDGTRTEAARALIFLASKFGLPQVKSAVLAGALPSAEEGHAVAAGDGLTVFSPRGMAVWLAPLVRDMIPGAAREMRFRATGR